MRSYTVRWSFQPIEPFAAHCQHAPQRRRAKMRERSLAGRIGRHMENTKVQEHPEVQSANTPVRELKTKSSFDNAEYERWCEKLRNRRRAATK